MKIHKRVKKSGPSTPIGIVQDLGRIGLLCYDAPLMSNGLHIYWSNDGIEFESERHPIVIYRGERLEKVDDCRDFNFAREGGKTVLTYIRDSKQGPILVTAVSRNMHSFDVIGGVPKIKDKCVVVSDFTPKDNHMLMYVGGLFIRSAIGKPQKEWKISDELLFTSRSGDFDRGVIKLMGAHMTPKGILVIYDASYKDEENVYHVQAGGVLFSPLEPNKILWRSELPLWKATVDTHHHSIRPLASALFNDEIILYWASKDTVLQAEIPAHFISDPKVDVSRLILKKFKRNPIIDPHPHNEWENEAVFNPAAIYDGGEVHLIYRAIGSKGISVFGYCASKDGLSFIKRSPHPVYEPNPGFDIPEQGKITTPQVYNPAMYTSGGGWGGCEDPRTVKIGDRVYMTYVAFGGWNSIRIALTSISIDDFRKEKWNWRKPVFLSPPKETHKNWVLFPEKINGKFAVLHGIAPEILIDYIDDLDNVTKYIKSKRPQGPQPGRAGFWDSKVRGVGPPPIKTDLGWLIFYHATDVKDPNKYKLGAMILDLHDPRKVLYRTSKPILSPEMNYENEGKPGVVYASGAIIKDDHIYIYYGGGDRVVCVAVAPLDEFLEDIKKDKSVPFSFKNYKVA